MEAALPALHAGRVRDRHGLGVERHSVVVRQHADRLLVELRVGQGASRTPGAAPGRKRAGGVALGQGLGLARSIAAATPVLAPARCGDDHTRPAIGLVELGAAASTLHYPPWKSYRITARRFVGLVTTTNPASA